MSAIGAIETAAYALGSAGAMSCATALASDALTLCMPNAALALLRRRSPAVLLAVLFWGLGASITLSNLGGFVGTHVEQYEATREASSTQRSLILERLARLRSERQGIAEVRPIGTITAMLNDARRSERPALQGALAMARRRDQLDVELVSFEKRLAGLPSAMTTDASASVLSQISGMAISEADLRRLRLAALLLLPLCGGLVVALARALMPRRETK